METTIKEDAIFNMSVEDIMISSEKVAHVQLNNPLEHALLILVKSGYAAVPVLDSQYRLEGVIGKHSILDEITGLERFEVEKLSTTTVKDVMISDVPYLKKSADFFTCMKVLIDHNFICIIDEDNYFEGIVTRRAVLKQINRYFHVNNLI